MNSSQRSLIIKRAIANREWQNFLVDLKKQPSVTVRKEICESWQRSKQYFPPDTNSKPVIDDPYETSFRWQESPIREVAKRELGQLMEMTAAARCAVAISDPKGRLLWTYASPHMESWAHDEHFIAGAHWGEHDNGTNALAVSLQTQQPSTVFSAEHYKHSLHEWVTYAAPIIDPKNQQILGAIDFSSTWDQYNPMTQAAAFGMSQAISQSLARHALQPRKTSPKLKINLLGNRQIHYNGQLLRLSLRHTEILCLLALNPEGISLERLHNALYGDLPVTKNTLKSEISTLRNLLDGHIKSRPYQLEIPIKADFIDLWGALKKQQLKKALKLYNGSLLAESTSPEIADWRHSIDAIMQKMLEGCHDLHTILQQCNIGASELLREKLQDLAAN